MNAAIIFHSVCGNCYHIGNEFLKAFQKFDTNTSLYRVFDEDLEIRSKKFTVAAKNYEAISSIPVTSPDIMLDNDIIVIGSPTYYYNVSAEIKSFLDLAVRFYVSGDLSGKIFGTFTAASTTVGGGGKCLDALACFARQMEMVHPPVPLNLQNETCLSQDGIIHHSGIFSDKRLESNTISAIKSYVEFLVRKTTREN